MYFDPIYMLIALPPMLLSLWAGWQVKSTFNRYHQVGARSGVSGARCAERASEAGARGRTNKVSGRLITAILFGSAARRCSWENRIFCYQMTVRFEALCAETSNSRTT